MVPRSRRGHDRAPALGRLGPPPRRLERQGGVEVVGPVRAGSLGHDRRPPFNAVRVAGLLGVREAAHGVAARRGEEEVRRAAGPLRGQCVAARDQRLGLRLEVALEDDGEEPELLVDVARGAGVGQAAADQRARKLQVALAVPLRERDDGGRQRAYEERHLRPCVVDALRGSQSQLRLVRPVAHDPARAPPLEHADDARGRGLVLSIAASTKGAPWVTRAAASCSGSSIGCLWRSLPSPYGEVNRRIRTRRLALSLNTRQLQGGRRDAGVKVRFADRAGGRRRRRGRGTRQAQQAYDVNQVTGEYTPATAGATAPIVSRLKAKEAQATVGSDLRSEAAKGPRVSTPPPGLPTWPLNPRPIVPVVPGTPPVAATDPGDGSFDWPPAGLIAGGLVALAGAALLARRQRFPAH